MKYEQFKTVTLIALIGLSLFFTYQLWNFQPHMQALEEESEAGGNSAVAETLVGLERDVTEFVQPEAIILHEQNERYAMIEKTNGRFDYTYNQLLDYELQHAIQTEPAPTYEGIELRFPDRLPLQYVLKQMDETFEISYMREVDRMLFYIDREEGAVNVELALEDSEQMTAIRTNMHPQDLIHLMSTTDQEDAYPVTVGKETDDEHLLLRNAFYVSTEVQSVPEVHFRLERLSAERINQRLFSGTDIPRQSQVNGEYLYTDGSRIVSHDSTISYLNYSYPFSTESNEASSRHILDVGVEFINLTGGWNNHFVFDRSTSREASEQIEFRMHVNNLPVFERGLSEEDRMVVSLSRAGTQIVNMQRPLFKLEGAPFIEVERSVSSGQAAVEAIKRESPSEWENVTDMQLGYRATMKNWSHIELDPVWYYKVDGQWKRVSFDEEITQ